MTQYRRHAQRFSAVALPLAAGAILLMGCGLLEPAVGSGAVLFQDDFNRTSSGWDRYRDSNYIADYAQDGYHIKLLEPQTEAWSDPGLDLGDVAIEVDAAAIDGPSNNAYGILCRYQDPQNFAFFLISSDGYAGVGVMRQGQRQMLSAGAMLPNPAIHTGRSANHLQARCVGEVLTFLVNSQPVAQVQASLWERGDLGLIAASYDQAEVDVRFDNFSVTQP
jgi:hypothetical protein